MNLNDYLELQDELDLLYADLENARSDSEADGIQRKIYILEDRIDRLFNKEPIYKQPEEDEY